MDGKLTDKDIEDLVFGKFVVECFCKKKGDRVEFADGMTIMLGPDGIVTIGCDLAAMPDDARPVSAVDANTIYPVYDTSDELDWQRKERLERELIEKNKKSREEIRRILGQ